MPQAVGAAALARHPHCRPGNRDATCFAAQLERAAKVMQPERNDPNVRMRQERASKFAFNPTTCRGPVRVKSVILSVGGSLPVCPQLRTFSAPVGMSQRCQLRTLF